MSGRVEFLPADVLGLSALAREGLSGRLGARIAGLVWARSGAELEPPPVERDPLAREGRAALVDRLERGVAGLEPPVGVLDALRSLAEPGASFVLACRPAGLFASPLATLHAGAAALRLARELRSRWGRPVVAGLWIEDSGWEQPEAWVLGRHHDLLRLSLEGLESEPWPARVPLGPQHGLGALRAAARHLFGDHPHLGATLERLAPREGESLARGTARALAGLLGAQGLVPIDPAWLREDLAKALARLAGGDPRPALERTARALAGVRGGSEAAGELEAGLVALRAEPAGRERLRVGGEGFESLGQPGSRTPAELAAAVAQDARAWSPGPVLLPAALELCLPLAVHCIEPGDLYAHLTRPALLAGLDREARPLVLRASLTLVEPEVRASLERAGHSVEVLLRGAVEAASTSSSSQGPHTPHSAAASLRDAGREARRIVLAPKAELDRIDPGLGGQLSRIYSSLSGDLERLAGRAERARANQLGQSRRRSRRMAAALAPRGEAQESVLSPFQILARHGSAWLEVALTQIEGLGAEHVVLDL